MSAPLGNTNSVGHGAPRGNSNRTTHGIRGYLARGRMPKGAEYDGVQLRKFEGSLNGAVLENDGEISLYKAALIQTTLRHEGRAHLLNRWLVAEKALTVAERVKISEAIGNASDSRDKCLKLLGLDTTRTANPWAAVDAPTLPQHAANGWHDHHDGLHEVSTSGGSFLGKKNSSRLVNRDFHSGSSSTLFDSNKLSSGSASPRGLTSSVGIVTRIGFSTRQPILN